MNKWFLKYLLKLILNTKNLDFMFFDEVFYTGHLLDFQCVKALEVKIIDLILLN